ncbi:CRISPR-associated endoribonuclease Cas6 [Coprothermobacter platensis]|uniref:CRISPR-associated endoribonuclease Cas6 n=1 Tax=Coprothermobacter platensis TaxID=108819 RepID=UPI00037AF713|nr:CRISPR-associated endoribonuclease Cas6 [Coprothermobacter platensis]
MRIKVQFISLDGKPITLPLQYLYSIHKLVYQMFTPETARLIYIDGFPYGNKKLKLFSYSRILEHGKVNKEKREISFDKTMTFYFSSSLLPLVEDFVQNAFTKEEIRLGGNNILLTQCEIMPDPPAKQKITIRMESPLTVYDSFSKNGKVFTHYYAPVDSQAKILVEENAKSKYAATQVALGNSIHENAFNDMHLSIEPKHFNIIRDKKLVYFKGKVIEGYTGYYLLQGNPELIKITYDCGLGASTSQGFGVWSPVESKGAVT